MARESFRMQMRSITRPEVIKFVNEEKTALRELGKEAKLMGNDATWGPMLKTFSVFDQMGAKGVFMHFGKQLGWDTKKLQRISIVAGTAADGFMKMQQGIAPLMETIGMGGIAAPVAGVAAWFMLPKDQRDKLIVQFKETWKLVSAEFMRQWPEISKTIGEAWDGFSKWFTETAWPVISKAADDAFTYLFKEGGPIDKGIVILKEWLGKMWDSAGTGGKIAMVGVIGVLINKIPGVGAVINSVVGGALNLAFKGIGSIAAASPGILGLGAVITGIGVVAINAWFDHLNSELDENIARQEKRIDEMYKRVKGLQEGTKETRKEMRDKFGVSGTGGTKQDIMGIDPTMKRAIMAQKDFAAMEEKAAQRVEAIGTPEAKQRALKMRNMAKGFQRVQGKSVV